MCRHAAQIQPQRDDRLGHLGAHSYQRHLRAQQPGRMNDVKQPLGNMGIYYRNAGDIQQDIARRAA